MSETLERLLPVIKHHLLGACLNDSERRIEANLENTLFSAYVVPSSHMERGTPSIPVEAEWVVFDFICMFREVPDETELAPIKDLILQGGNTEYQIWMENHEFFSVGIRSRLSTRAALTFPDLTQEIVLEMTGYAEKLSIWLHELFPESVPPAILEIFKDE
jgi:hypothetical protein